MSINISGIMTDIAVAKKAEPELNKLKKATDGFESVFLKKLFSQMRSTVKETQFGQTFGKDIFNDMFDEAMANAASKSKTLGMGDMLYNQFAPRVVEQFRQEEIRAQKSALAASQTPKLDPESQATKPEVREVTKP